MKEAKQEAGRRPSEIPPTLVPLAPMLMMAFWTLLGAAAGIRLAQSIWRLLGVDVGSVAIAVPLGGVVGALAGALLGLIRNPRMLVLLMAVFAGSAAGAVVGKVPWGGTGEIVGQVAGSMVGGIAWATWMMIEWAAPTVVYSKTASRDVHGKRHRVSNIKGDLWDCSC